ncbi:DUF1654 domain-containing protein [Pseudomonas sp. UBA6562]|uniref:DUF1654 domain-containing protein n=1 Tax=Pseudomonas sp. UBA6562 TaxID=1947332 RepID=UPI0025E73F8D|nr:DUF1654 domain-containing protein [Pseudomonas sp. UBA6562]
MARQKKQATQERQALNGVERLGLRISSMINHPTAQQQRWVTVHRLDSDGDAEWGEVMGMLGDTDGISLTILDDGGVMIEWEKPTDEDRQLEAGEVDAVDNMKG